MQTFDVVDIDGRVILSACEPEMADGFVARRVVPMFVVPHALGLCPKCDHAVVEGPAGGAVCDECGWHCRANSDARQTPLHGVIGGPMGACDK